ncbi:hypothetical protein [Variovorax sp. YR752]|uniref:hypothetical protein n=1 Tax=Variovorax sp. YR752 TaxID=1884383 RepID=UPI003137759E
MSWFKKILDAARGIVVKEGEDYVLEELTTVNNVTAPPVDLVPDEDYVTIEVRSSRIVAVRKWTGKFYSSVQSRVSYLHDRAGQVELQQVIVPKLGELDVLNVDRFIVVDKPVVGPVPYKGRLSMELGLFSVKGGDLAGSYLELLDSLASVSGVSFLSAARPYIEPLKKGADLLFGNSNQSTLEVGLDKTWDQLRTGTWVLIRGPKGKVDVSQIRLDSEDGKITDTKGNPYKDYPYVVFRIRRSRQRADWMLIPELKEGWEAIRAAVQSGQSNEAEVRMKNFIQLARWSADLVPEDAKRLADKARSTMGLIQPQEAIASIRAPFPSLEALALYPEQVQ